MDEEPAIGGIVEEDVTLVGEEPQVITCYGSIGIGTLGSEIS